MSIALPPLPAAAPAPSASVSPPQAASITTPAVDGTTEADQPGFQSTLQRIALAGLSRPGGAVDAALASIDDDAGTDSDTAAAPGQNGAVSDLMLSGMLLTPVALPVAGSGAVPQAAQADAASLPGLTSVAVGGPATGAPAAMASDTPANGPAEVLPPVAPALRPLAGDSTPVTVLASAPVAARFVLEKLARSATNAADTPDTPAAAPSRPAGATAALAPLAPVAATTDGGTAREHRNLPSGNFAAMDLQGLEAVSGAAPGVGADSATRTNGTSGPAMATATGPHSLIETLGDRIALQLQRGSERAVIRLDPPMQGQLEITIRHDATGATQVHLSASNSDVVRQLQTLSDSLRQELVHRQAGEVTVVVSQSGRDQDGRQRQNQQAAPQEEPGRGLADAGDTSQNPARFTLSTS